MWALLMALGDRQMRGGERRRRRLFTRNFLVIVASWMLWSPVHNLVGGYEPLYIKALGATSTILGLIYAALAAAQAVARFPGGYIADRFGRRRLIVVMGFLYAFTLLLYAVAPDWRLILFAAVLGGIFLIYEPALTAIMADSIPPERRGLGYGFATALPSLVSLPAPLLAGYLVSTYGLVSGMRRAYVIGALLGITASALRFVFLEETYRGGDSAPILKDFARGYMETFRFVLKEASALVTLHVLLAVAYGIYPFVSPYAVEYVRVDAEIWYQVYLAAVAANFLLSVPMGYLIDKLGRRKAGILASLLFTVSAPLYILAASQTANSTPLITIAYSLTSVSINALLNVNSALRADLVPKRGRGRAFTVLLTIWSLSLAASRCLCGILYDAVDPRLPFIQSSVVMVVFVLVLLFWLEEPKRREA